MNSYRVPRDKLVAVVNCCRLLLRMLSINSDGPASADDFLPSLIYALILAAPDNVHTNLDFMQHYRQPNKLSGIVGYFFTSLCSAVSFVENALPHHLNLSQQAFDQYE
jgi:hypothetical protein